MVLWYRPTHQMCEHVSERGLLIGLYRAQYEFRVSVVISWLSRADRTQGKVAPSSLQYLTQHW